MPKYQFILICLAIVLGGPLLVVVGDRLESHEWLWRAGQHRQKWHHQGDSYRRY